MISKVFLMVCACASLALPVWAQQDATDASAPIVPSSPTSRVLGVLPNYRTADDTGPFEPLSVRRKFYIGYKDSTDYPVFLLAAGMAGLAQLTDQHEAYRTGRQRL